MNLFSGLALPDVALLRLYTILVNYDAALIAASFVFFAAVAPPIRISEVKEVTLKPPERLRTLTRIRKLGLANHKRSSEWIFSYSVLRVSESSLPIL